MPREWSIQQVCDQGEAYPASFFATEAEAREAWAALSRMCPGNTLLLRDPAARTVDAHRAPLS